MYGHGIVTLAWPRRTASSPDRAPWPVRRADRAVKVISSQAVKKASRSPEVAVRARRGRRATCRSPGGTRRHCGPRARRASTCRSRRSRRRSRSSSAAGARTKSFSYQPGSDGQPGPTASRSSASTCSTPPRIALSFRSPPRRWQRPVDDRFPYYSQYYATQATPTNSTTLPGPRRPADPRSTHQRAAPGRTAAGRKARRPGAGPGLRDGDGDADAHGAVRVAAGVPEVAAENDRRPSLNDQQMTQFQRPRKDAFLVRGSPTCKTADFIRGETTDEIGGFTKRPALHWSVSQGSIVAH